MTQTATGTETRPLPAGWKWVKLGDVCSYISGNAWKSSGYSNGPNGLPIIRIQNLDAPINSNYVFWLDTYDSRYLIHSGDLLLSLSGSFKAVRWSGPNALLNQRILKLTPKTDVTDEWLLTSISNALEQISLLGKHSIINNVSVRDLQAFEIPLPPLEEQKRIAAILNEQIAAVETAKKAAEERLAAAKALPAAYLREVFEGEEYETWVEYSLDEIMEFKNGVNFAGDKKGQGLLTIDVLNMYSENIYPNYDGLYRVDIAPPKEYYLNAGDVLFVRSSVKKEGVGWASLFDGFDEPITYCGFIIRGRLKNESISPEFIVHQLRSYQVRQEIIQSSGTSAITNISQQKLKAITLRIPQQEQQIEIVARLGDKLAGVSLAEKSIQQELETIEAMPAALLRKAFSGEL